MISVTFQQEINHAFPRSKGIILYNETPNNTSSDRQITTSNVILHEAGAHSSAIRLSKDSKSAFGGTLTSKPASASDGCKFITKPWQTDERNSYWWLTITILTKSVRFHKKQMNVNQLFNTILSHFAIVSAKLIQYQDNWVNIKRGSIPYIFTNILAIQWESFWEYLYEFKVGNNKINL